ncbi:MAG: mannose-1-phosphate guanylyltransferase/mannose-6-phosphate isomerase [Pseudomonadota bacterium]
MTLIPIILCGGSGTRLWPVSREQHPKPFIHLPNGKSLLQSAIIRGAELPSVSELMIVTNKELLFKIEDEFKSLALNQLAVSFLLEPFGRNTAPAIALAALQIAASNPDAILLVLPADHLVTNTQSFHEAVAKAVLLARQGKLITFGIRPTHPETGYGYIEAEGHTVTQFIEKPSLDKALVYAQSGKHLWNSGMFCFTARTVLSELKRVAPELYDAAELCLSASRYTPNKQFSVRTLSPESFGQLPDISIDYALMEKSDKIAVVPCDIGWHDIGSWHALSQLYPTDAQGNCVVGNALLQNTNNCYVQSTHRMVGGVGLDDLIIIDTPDALLVANRSETQNVKNLVQKLKKMNHPSHKVHTEVHRPWGTYSVLEEEDRFKIKRIVVKPGASLSLQMHHHRSEHWIVVSGMAKVVNGTKEFFINTNESTYIPAGNVHRLENPGVINLVMIEVQSGDYLGEDDIIRFEDAYGRVPEGTTQTS